MKRVGLSIALVTLMACREPSEDRGGEPPVESGGIPAAESTASRQELELSFDLHPYALADTLHVHVRNMRHHPVTHYVALEQRSDGGLWFEADMDINAGVMKGVSIWKLPADGVAELVRPIRGFEMPGEGSVFRLAAVSWTEPAHDESVSYSDVLTILP